jgi:hypothetical protein
VFRGDSPPPLPETEPETEPAAAVDDCAAAAAAAVVDGSAYSAVPECDLKGPMLSRHSPGGVVRVVGAAVAAAAAAGTVSAAEPCRLIDKSGCESRAVAPASEPCVRSGRAYVQVQ